MKSYRFLLLKIIVIVCGIWAAQPALTAQEIQVPDKPATLVKPILDAMRLAVKKQPVDESEGSPFWHSGELLGRLFKDRSRASDEALIVLLSYYLGESNGGDLVDEITERGRRMLPYLERYECCLARIPGRQYPDRMVLPSEVRRSLFEEAITNIKKPPPPERN